MTNKLWVGVSALALATVPALASASVVGFLGNFDVINDTGQTAHGFEIELEGLHSSDVTDVFGGPGRGFPTGRGFDPSTSVERYGAPSITEYTNGATFGTRITYYGTFSGGVWDYSTPTVPVGSFATPGDNCWSGGGLGYSAATPCDHFGVGTRANASKTTYSWLFGDASGTLSRANGAVSLPAPAWEVIPSPPAEPNLPPPPPQVVARVAAPEPEVPEINGQAQWGTAMWVKVFTTELENPVGLEELVGDNAKVADAETEIEWQLLQYDPGNPATAFLESGYGAPVGPNAASILRRYEFYKFGGEYDPKDHHAILEGDDSNPLGNDVGAYIGAQNAAANLVIAAPVPEPETYAMLLAGLALVGGIARRRAR